MAILQTTDHGAGATGVFQFLGNLAAVPDFVHVIPAAYDTCPLACHPTQPQLIIHLGLNVTLCI